MKFCPQCGTPFDPETRFCAECGFDRSLVESVSPTPPLAPEVLFTDEKTDTSESVKAKKPQPKIEPACPQCGTELSSGDRFCAECGFDILGIEDVKVEIPQEIQEPIVEESTIVDSPAEETILTKVNTQLCPQCGTDIDTDERFCPECGFDTSGIKDVAEDAHLAVPQSSVDETIVPESPVAEIVSTLEKKQFCPQCGTDIDIDERFCQACGFDTKSDQTTHDTKPEPIAVPFTEIKSSAKPLIPEPQPEPVRATAPIYKQTPQEGEPATQQKGENTWRRIVLIIIGFGILGASGWFVYNKYFANSKNTSDNAITNTKPMSLMDQELAKQKAKVQNQATQQNTTKQDAIDAALTKERDIISKVILEVGLSDEPKNKNPKNPTKLTISKPTMITRITTDHYNDGMGTPRGGIITIKDRNGMVIAAYKALGKTGKNGTPSAKWVAEPNKIFNKGTYLIWDSDPQTWSKTLVGSNGFVIVEGYEVE